MGNFNGCCSQDRDKFLLEQMKSESKNTAIYKVCLHTLSNSVETAQKNFEGHTKLVNFDTQKSSYTEGDFLTIFDI